MKGHGTKLEVHRKRAELRTKKKTGDPVWCARLSKATCRAGHGGSPAGLIPQRPWGEPAGGDREDCDAGGRGSGVARGVPLSYSVLVRTKGTCQGALRGSAACAYAVRGTKPSKSTPLVLQGPRPDLSAPFPGLALGTLAIRASVGAWVLGARNPG